MKSQQFLEAVGSESSIENLIPTVLEFIWLVGSTWLGIAKCHAQYLNIGPRKLIDVLCASRVNRHVR